MKRVGLLLSGFVLAVLFGGTIVYAAIQAPAPDGLIHACYDKGGKGAGKIRLVQAGKECKTSELPVSWRAINEFEELGGMPCTFQARPGAIELVYDGAGVAEFRCSVPAVCGDGLIEGGEQCDDGNVLDGDGCSSTCQAEDEPTCGELGLTDCNGTCTNTETDPLNCGGCNLACELDEACSFGVCGPA